MVEVDVFWAYGIGAACAAAAGRQLKKSDKPFDTPYFTKTVLLLALVWAPTGLLLLLRHPSWETMQLAPTFAALPPWLVLGFGITNVTQGILGFWVGWWLLRKDRAFFAQLNWMMGYFAMFFVLLYGWDGHGYDRFLYDRDMFGGVPWTPGAGLQSGAGVGFLSSSVAMTLYLDGVYLLPPMFALIARWQRDEAGGHVGVGRFVGLHLAMVFGPALFTAAFSAICVHIFARAFGDSMVARVGSYVVGLPISMSLAYLALYAKGRPLERFFSRALVLDSNADSATPTLAARAS